VRYGQMFACLNSIQQVAAPNSDRLRLGIYTESIIARCQHRAMRMPIQRQSCCSLLVKPIANTRNLSLYAMAMSFCLSVCLFVCLSPVKFVKAIRYVAAPRGKQGLSYRLPYICFLFFKENNIMIY